MEINLANIDFNPGQGGGGVRPSGTLDISENGVYDVYSYASASVSVHPSTSLSETYTSNGTYNISGEFNGGEITVEVSAPQFITETLSVSSNGTYIPSVGVDGFSEVIVNVPQSVTGYTEKDFTEKNFTLTSLNNSASFVGSMVFQNNAGIETINLPECKYVGNNAFDNCTHLSYISLPNCISIFEAAFKSCSLTTLDLPKCENITGFWDCKRLTTVNLPECKIIGVAAFSNCWSLTQINIPNCYSINGSNVFAHCTSLSSISLPNLKFINNGNTIFAYCGLQDISLPNVIEIGGAWTFNDNSYMSKAYLPTVLKVGRNYQFERDSNLTEIYIDTETYKPSDLYCFLSSGTNSNITSIYTDINNISGFETARGWSFWSSKFVGIGDSNIKMLEYSDGVLTGYTRVIDNQFYGLTGGAQPLSILSVNLPECHTIASTTFDGCRNLSTVNLPKCEHIYDRGFNNCSNLSQVNLPVCSYIGSLAFYRYNQQSFSLTLGYSSVCTLSGQLWDGAMISLLNIYVPSGLVDAYKSAKKWSAYSSRIFPIE